MRSHCLTSVVKRPAHIEEVSLRDLLTWNTAKFIARYRLVTVLLNSYRTPLPGSRFSVVRRSVGQMADKRPRTANVTDRGELREAIRQIIREDPALLHANFEPNVDPIGPAAGKCLILFLLSTVITWFLGEHAKADISSTDHPAAERVVTDLNLPVFHQEADVRQPPDSDGVREMVKNKKSESVEGTKATSFLLGEGLLPIPPKLVAKIQKGDFVDITYLLPDNIEAESRRGKEGSASSSTVQN